MANEVLFTEADVQRVRATLGQLDQQRSQVNADIASLETPELRALWKRRAKLNAKITPLEEIYYTMKWFRALRENEQQPAPTTEEGAEAHD